MLFSRTIGISIRGYNTPSKMDNKDRQVKMKNEGIISDSDISLKINTILINNFPIHEVNFLVRTNRAPDEIRNDCPSKKKSS